MNKCVYDYVGIIEKEEDIEDEYRAIAYLTYKDIEMKKKYGVTVIGLDDRYIEYGLKEDVPYYVSYYELDIATYIFYGICIIAMCIFMSITCKGYFGMAKRYEYEKEDVYDEEKYEKESLINESCSICLDEYQKQEMIVVMRKCGHVFHKKCINEWLEGNDRCPNCNENVFNEESELVP